MDSATDTGTRWIVLGHITGLYGVQGWVKVFSHTEPRAGITEYNPLYLATTPGTSDNWQAFQVAAGRAQGKGVVIKFSGIDDRDTAADLLNQQIAIKREQLPALAQDDFYWADLEGLRVVAVDGTTLGIVDHLFATGANDVVVVKGEREHLIPFLRNTVINNIDLAAGVMTVDWDPEF